jgi:hypothetical protein
MKTIVATFFSFMFLSSGAWLEAQASPSSSSAFERLQSLVGDWEASREGGEVIRVSYKAMSNNSILVETYRTPSGKETLSVYHLDGKRLLLTHYCAQGNQPRLRYAPDKGDAQRLVFNFMDATNLPSKKKEHMARLEVRLVDTDHFEQASIYRAGKEEETTVLKFARVPEK